jgi:DNA-binding HxlR family transcriptional regulator
VWALYVVASFATALVLHALLCRSRLQGDSVSKFLVAGSSVGLSLVLTLVTLNGFGLSTWAGLLSYAFICELYIFLFTLVGSSVSASLLIRMRRGNISIAEIDRIYSSHSMVEERLETLKKHAFITRSPDGWTLTGKGKRVLVLFRTLRRIFRHAGEFGATDFRKAEKLHRKNGGA